jgi:hypothetical protein
MINFFVVKKYKYDLNITSELFKHRFEFNLNNSLLPFGNHFKGKIIHDTFTIKPLNKISVFSIDPARQFAYFFELVGKYKQADEKLEVDLKLRIKTSIQIYWIITYVILAIPILGFDFTSSWLFFSTAVFISYVIMKIAIGISESFFIDSFKELYDFKNDFLKDSNIKIEEKENVKIIRTKKVKRISNDIGLTIFALLFLTAIYYGADLLKFFIYISVISFLFLSYHQFYQAYKIQQIRTYNEIVDFWLFYKMAKFPIPSLLFKLKKLEQKVAEKSRGKYNILTAFMYCCLINILILVLVKFEIV